MASNFTMRHHRREGGLHISLSGNFDGTSSYELKHCLQTPLTERRASLWTRTNSQTCRPSVVRCFRS